MAIEYANLNLGTMKKYCLYINLEGNGYIFQTGGTKIEDYPKKNLTDHPDILLSQQGYFVLPIPE